MTIKSSTLPISSGDKLRRFREWAEAHVPSLSYSSPEQTPIKTKTVTINLPSLEERLHLLNVFTKPSRIQRRIA